jgi:hypothetical protein
MTASQNPCAQLGLSRAGVGTIRSIAPETESNACDAAISGKVSEQLPRAGQHRFFATFGYFAVELLEPAPELPDLKGG